MNYNPTTKMVFAISKIYFDSLSAEHVRLTATENNKIKKLFMDNSEHGQVFDYFVAKTYLVVEILSNIMGGTLDMAMSLLSLVKDLYYTFESEDIREFDAGKVRIAEFVVMASDHPSETTLRSNIATQVLLGLYDMGYYFHPEFVEECATEFKNIYYL